MVSGCTSNTLGLSNTLSEVVEAVCMGIEDPYEVVSSEDMLARVHECNIVIEEMKRENVDTETKLIIFSLERGKQVL